jgi:hypothetical protein
VLPSRIEWRLRPHWNGISLHLTQDCCLPQGVEVALQRGLDAWRVSSVAPASRPAPARRQFRPGRAWDTNSTPIGEMAREPAGPASDSLRTPCSPTAACTLTGQNLAFAIRSGRGACSGTPSSRSARPRRASRRSTRWAAIASPRCRSHVPKPRPARAPTARA